MLSQCSGTMAASGTGSKDGGGVGVGGGVGGEVGASRRRCCCYYYRSHCGCGPPGGFEPPHPEGCPPTEGGWDMEARSDPRCDGCE